MTGRTQVRRRARLRAAGVGLAALVLGGSLSACLDQDDARVTSSDPTTETSAPESTEATPTPTTATPTPTPTPSSASPTPTPSPSRTVPPAPALTSRLLAAGSVAGLNAQWRWRDGETLTTEPTTGGIADCVRFSLAAIGAREAVSRSYSPPSNAADSPASAFEIVARFPDEQTAVRVMDVLRSWHSTCQRRLNNVSDKPHRVSPMETITAGDDAFAYLHTTPGSTKDTTQFEDVGQVRRGALIALVVVRLDEQDYNYAPKRTPAARSLAPAAARLG